MRTNLIRDLFTHLDADGSLQVGHCPEGANLTLEGLPFPIDLKRMLQWSWINHGADVGKYRLYSVEESLASEDLPKLITAGLFSVGCARNGDPLVFRFNENECAVGLLSHELLWEEDSDPKEAYIEVTRSIEEFLWRTVEGRYLPIDYHAALELLEMRKELNGAGIM